MKKQVAKNLKKKSKPVKLEKCTTLREFKGFENESLTLILHRYFNATAAKNKKTQVVLLYNYLFQAQNTPSILTCQNDLFQTLLDIIINDCSITIDIRAKLISCVGLMGRLTIHYDKRWFDLINEAFDELENNEAQCEVVRCVEQLIYVDCYKQLYPVDIQFIMDLLIRLFERGSIRRSEILAMEQVLKLARQYPQFFSIHFKDVVDLLIGWYLNYYKQVESFVSKSLIEMNQFFAEDNEFMFYILCSLTMDLEKISFVNNSPTTTSKINVKEFISTVQMITMIIDGASDTFAACCLINNDFSIFDRIVSVVAKAENEIKDCRFSTYHCNNLFAKVNSFLYIALSTLDSSRHVRIASVQSYIEDQINQPKNCIIFCSLVYKFIEVTQGTLTVDFLQKLLNVDSVIIKLSQIRNIKVNRILIAIYECLFKTKRVIIVECTYKLLLVNMKNSSTLLSKLDNKHFYNCGKLLNRLKFYFDVFSIIINLDIPILKICSFKPSTTKVLFDDMLPLCAHYIFNYPELYSHLLSIINVNFAKDCEKQFINSQNALEMTDDLHHRFGVLMKECIKQFTINHNNLHNIIDILTKVVTNLVNCLANFDHLIHSNSVDQFLCIVVKSVKSDDIWSFDPTNKEYLMSAIVRLCQYKPIKILKAYTIQQLIDLSQEFISSNDIFMKNSAQLIHVNLPICQFLNCIPESLKCRSRLALYRELKTTQCHKVAHTTFNLFFGYITNSSKQHINISQLASHILIQSGDNEHLLKQARNDKFVTLTYLSWQCALYMFHYTAHCSMQDTFYGQLESSLHDIHRNGKAMDKKFKLSDHPRVDSLMKFLWFCEYIISDISKGFTTSLSTNIISNFCRNQHLKKCPDHLAWFTKCRVLMMSTADYTSNPHLVCWHGNQILHCYRTGQLAIANSELIACLTILIPAMVELSASESIMGIYFFLCSSAPLVDFEWVKHCSLLSKDQYADALEELKKDLKPLDNGKVQKFLTKKIYQTYLTIENEDELQNWCEEANESTKKHIDNMQAEQARLMKTYDLSENSDGVSDGRVAEAGFYSYDDPRRILMNVNQCDLPMLGKLNRIVNDIRRQSDTYDHYDNVSSAKSGAVLLKEVFNSSVEIESRMISMTKQQAIVNLGRICQKKSLENFTEPCSELLDENVSLRQRLECLHMNNLISKLKKFSFDPTASIKSLVKYTRKTGNISLSMSLAEKVDVGTLETCKLKMVSEGKNKACQHLMKYIIDNKDVLGGVEMCSALLKLQKWGVPTKKQTESLELWRSFEQLLASSSPPGSASLVHGNVPSDQTMVAKVLHKCIHVDDTSSKAWFALANWNYQWARKLIDSRNTMDYNKVELEEINDMLKKHGKTESDIVVVIEILSDLNTFISDYDHITDQDQNQGIDTVRQELSLHITSSQVLDSLVVIRQRALARHYHYYASAADAYFHYLQVTDKNCDTLVVLRLLRMIVKLSMELREKIEFILKNTPTEPWKVIMPQLVSRLNHPQAYIRGNIFDLISRISLTDPRLICFTALSASIQECEGKSSSNINTYCGSIVDTLTVKSPRMIHDARIFLEEMESIAMLWDEKCLYVLASHSNEFIRRVNNLLQFVIDLSENPLLKEEIKKMLLIEKQKVLFEPLLSVFTDLFNETLARDPTTVHEKRVCSEYKTSLQSLLDVLSMPFDYEHSNDVLYFYRKFLTRLHLSVNKTCNLRLSDISPRLASLVDTEIHMPGISDAKVKIQSIEENIEIIPSKTRPKKFCFIGCDLVKYSYLFKGCEDLHLDERIMQFISVVNKLLAKSSKKGHTYVARNYSVFPLGKRAGLIQWVDGVKPLLSIYSQYLKSREKDNTRKQYMEEFNKLIKYHIKDKNILEKRSQWPKDTMLTIFKELKKNTPNHILSNEIWRLALDCKHIWQIQQNFSRSVAVSSMIGHVIGLGDRHMDNILIDLQSGEVVHIDYNVCFDKGQHMRIPENVPFRLTQNIVQAMGVNGIEGVMRLSCEHVMHVMKCGRETLLTLLEAFVYDPLVDWTTGCNAQNNPALQNPTKDPDVVAKLSAKQRSNSERVELSIYILQYAAEIHQIKHHMISTTKQYIEYLKNSPIEQSSLPLIIKYLREAQLDSTQQSHPIFSLYKRLQQHIEVVLSNKNSKKILQQHYDNLDNINSCYNDTIENIKKDLISNPHSLNQDMLNSNMIQSLLDDCMVHMKPFLQIVSIDNTDNKFKVMCREVVTAATVGDVTVHRLRSLMRDYARLADLFDPFRGDHNSTTRWKYWLMCLRNDFSVNRCKCILNEVDYFYGPQAREDNQSRMINNSTILQSLQEQLDTFSVYKEKISIKKTVEKLSILKLDTNLNDCQEDITQFINENGEQMKNYISDSNIIQLKQVVQLIHVAETAMFTQQSDQSTYNASDKAVAQPSSCSSLSSGHNVNLEPYACDLASTYEFIHKLLDFVHCEDVEYRRYYKQLMDVENIYKHLKTLYVNYTASLHSDLCQAYYLQNFAVIGHIETLKNKIKFSRLQRDEQNNWKNYRIPEINNIMETYDSFLQGNNQGAKLIKLLNDLFIGCEKHNFGDEKSVSLFKLKRVITVIRLCEDCSQSARGNGIDYEHSHLRKYMKEYIMTFVMGRTMQSYTYLSKHYITLSDAFTPPDCLKKQIHLFAANMKTASRRCYVSTRLNDSFNIVTSLISTTHSISAALRWRYGDDLHLSKLPLLQQIQQCAASIDIEELRGRCREFKQISEAIQRKVNRSFSKEASYEDKLFCFSDAINYASSAIDTTTEAVLEGVYHSRCITAMLDYNTENQTLYEKNTLFINLINECQSKCEITERNSNFSMEEKQLIGHNMINNHVKMSDVVLLQKHFSEKLEGTEWLSIKSESELLEKKLNIAIYNLHRLVGPIGNPLNILLQNEMVDGDFKKKIQEFVVNFRNLFDNTSKILKEGACNDLESMNITIRQDIEITFASLMKLSSDKIQKDNMLIDVTVPEMCLDADINDLVDQLKSNFILCGVFAWEMDSKNLNKYTKQGRVEQQRNAVAVKVWKVIRNKLGDGVNTRSYVDTLLKEATDAHNLSRLYEGWMAWV